MEGSNAKDLDATKCVDFAFGEASRGNSCTPSTLSIDPRATTPLLRYGGRSYTPSTSVTPTPPQWARNDALNSPNSGTPRCATALGRSLRDDGTLELTFRPASSSAVTRPRSVTDGGYFDRGQLIDPRSPASSVGLDRNVASPSVDLQDTWVTEASGDEQQDYARNSQQLEPYKPECSAKQRVLLSQVTRIGGKPRILDLPITPPPKMSPPTARPINAWRHRIEWVPAAGCHEDTDYGYALSCSTLGSQHTLTIDDLGNVSHAFFDHLEPGSTYFFQVCACNTLGFGEWSNPSIAYAVPTPPRSLCAEAGSTLLSYSASATSAILRWEEPCDHGSEIVGYNVQYTLNPAHPETIETLSCQSNRTWVEVVDLLPNSVYYFRTQAINDVGISGWTDWSRGVATRAVEPEQPDPPQLVEAKTRELFIRWARPHSCGFRITKYTVRISESKRMEDAVILPVKENKAQAKIIGVGDWVDVTKDEALLDKSCRMSPMCSRFTRQQRQSKLGAKGKVMETDAQRSVVKLNNGIDWVPVKALDQAPQQATRDAICDDDCTLRVVDLQPNHIYYFQVRAESEFGASLWSEASKPFSTEPSLPEMCKKVCVIANQYERAQIQWVAPKSFGADIESFVVRYRRAAHPRKELQRLEVQATQETSKAGAVSELWVEGVTPGACVVFEVAARSSAGLGPFSEPSEEVVLLAGRPGEPPPPTVKVRTTTSMMVQVQDTTPTFGCEVRTYECRWANQPTMTNAVQVMGAMQETSRPHPDLPRVFEIPVTGLTRRGPYYFSVRAVCDVGKSVWSTPSEPLLLIVDAPMRMSAPHLVQAELSALVIGYTPAADLGVTMGGRMWEYEMRYSRWKHLLEEPGWDSTSDSQAHEEIFLHRWSAPNATRSVPPPQRVENLLTGRSYYFQARSISSCGPGPWSFISAPFECVPSRPDTPQVPDVTRGTDSPYCITVTITLPEDNGRKIDRCRLWVSGPWWEDRPGNMEWRDLYEIGPIDVREHKVKRPRENDAGDPEWLTFWEHSVINLNAGAFYRFKVSCRNLVGWSDVSGPSVPLSTSPTCPDQCQPPELASEATHNSAKIMWAVPHDGGAALSHYIMSWSDNPRFENPRAIDRIDEPSLLLENLEPYQWYYIKVAAVNSVGAGKHSEIDKINNIGCFLTKATVPGGVPNIRAELTSSDTVHLTWDKPPCNGGHIISKYKIFISKSETLASIENEHITKNACKQCHLHDLVPDAVYYFDICALNSVGYGPLSGKPACVQTPSVPPDKAMLPVATAAPTCTLLAGAGRSSLIVQWVNPENYDKKKGFIYKADVQTHMILEYNVRIMEGNPDPELAKKVSLLQGIRQVRDRRTVPKDEHNNANFFDILPGRHYSAMVQSVNEVGVSPWSEVSVGVISAGARPDEPKDLHLVDCKEHSMIVEWICPHGNGSEITSFNLRWRSKKMTQKRKSHWLQQCKQAESGGTDNKRDSSLAVAAAKTRAASISAGTNAKERRSTLEARMSLERLEVLNDEDHDDTSSESDADDDEEEQRPRTPARLSRMKTDNTKMMMHDIDYEGITVDFKKCLFQEVPSEVDVDEYAPVGGFYEGMLCRYEITGLTAGRFFGAHVQAENEVGRSLWTRSDLMRTISTVPHAPFACKVVEGTVTETGLCFQWSQPLEDGGEPIEGYEVLWGRVLYRQALPISAQEIQELSLAQRLELGPDVYRHQVDGLKPGHTVVPVVRCWNVVGFSDWSQLPSPMELKEFATLPTAPDPVIHQPILSQSASKDYRPYSLTACWKCPHVNGWPVKFFILKIELGGQPPAKSEDGPGLSRTEIRVEHDGVSPEWSEGDDVSCEFVHEQLIPGAPYVLNVRAGTGGAVGDCQDWGATSQQELAPPDYPLQPKPVISPWQWPDGLQVNWDEPCMSGLPPSTCEVRYSRKPDMSNMVYITREEDIANALEKQELIINKLGYITSYYFQVRISNAVGWSEWSLVSSEFITKACRPYHPERIQARDVQKEHMSVHWNPPSDHGSAITEYDIVMVDSHQAPNLQGVIDQANACNYSTGEAFIPEKAHAAVEQVLSTIAIRSRAALKVHDLKDFNEPMHVFTGLLGGITYSIAVRAYNAEGWSDWSPVLSVETPCSRPEQCPDLCFLKATQDSVTVQYQMPYDNGAPITKFLFYWTRIEGPTDWHKARMFGGSVEDHRSSAAGTFHIDIAPGQLKRALPNGIGGSGECFVDALEPGTWYEVQVCAENNCGRGDYSEMVRMQTLPGRPDAPLDVRHESEPRSIVPLAEVKRVGHTSGNERKTEFSIEGGQLIKYVDGTKMVGREGTSGVVTSLKYKAGSKADHYEVCDQHGWGSDDHQPSFVWKLKEMADTVGVPNNLPEAFCPHCYRNMKWTNSVPGTHSENRWVCDKRCGKDSSSGTAWRWFCARCQTNFCTAACSQSKEAATVSVSYAETSKLQNTEVVHMSPGQGKRPPVSRAKAAIEVTGAGAL